MADRAADFKGFVLGLSPEAQRQLAERAGTTLGNLKAHWIHARRVPKGREGLNKLYGACERLGAPFSKQQLLAFFYSERAA